MNKAELIDAIALKSGLAKKDSAKALAAVTEAVTEALVNGDKVQIVGFGGFEVRNRPARTARNPRTGDPITIAASKAPVFKAGKALKDSINVANAVEEVIAEVVEEVVAPKATKKSKAKKK